MKPVALLTQCLFIEVYMVPDVVADNLEKYADLFFKWLKNSEYAEEFRRQVLIGDRIVNSYICDHTIFIDYLNTWLFPDQPSHLVGELDALKGKDPRYEEYLNAPHFNF